MLLKLLVLEQVISRHRFGRQVKAARALVDMNLKEIAAVSGVSVNQISRIETCQADFRDSTKQRLIVAFAGLGVKFIDATADDKTIGVTFSGDIKLSDEQREAAIRSFERLQKPR